MTCIFFGISGSGKGTQAELLAARWRQEDPTREVLYLETGGRYREFTKAGNWSSRKTKQIMDSGQRVPAFLSVWNWTSALIERYTGNEHIIIDGSPRSLLEAEALHTALEFYELLPATILFLQTSANEASRRLQLRGRTDDTSAGIAKRHDWFVREVMPVVDFYQTLPEQYHFRTINGEQSREAVSAEIASAL